MILSDVPSLRFQGSFSCVNGIIFCFEELSSEMLKSVSNCFFRDEGPKQVESNEGAMEIFSASCLCFHDGFLGRQGIVSPAL